ncbi:PTS sugar transporter subunit IIA [Sporosarcina ureilytica]|uniref:PTS EIIA type-2 domain-containing protein n=1 Tax=Sporosarcina ureilytica TaxID=298596 RepID=A0A1D8JJ03_9BACL|nr:PTS sugar transporter subunit IIA [Sporosarcina ureilytica]AOV08691.1 hypothetical protein BI350_14850 [Sporosarcina ureilytica]
MYVEKDLVFYDRFFENQEQLFDFMADELEKKNYVTKGFREAIKKREKEYPTGMQLKDMNIALVHTEAKFSKAEKLVVLQLEQPVTFQNIEDLQPIKVDFVFGLILNDSNKHLEVLQQISLLLQSKEGIRGIKGVKSQAELWSLMKYYFNKKENVE